MASTIKVAVTKLKSKDFSNPRQTDELHCILRGKNFIRLMLPGIKTNNTNYYWLIRITWRSSWVTTSGLQIISRLAPVKLSGPTYFPSDISHFWPDTHECKWCKDLTGQNLFLTGHCPLTGRYLQPCTWCRQSRSGSGIELLFLDFLGVSPSWHTEKRHSVW